MEVTGDTSNVDFDFTNGAPKLVKPPDMFAPSLPGDSLKRKRRRNQEEIDEVSLFRRVHIYNNIHSLDSLNPLYSYLDYHATVYEFRDNNWHDCGTGFVDTSLECKVS